MKKNTSKEVKKYSHLSFEEREEMAIGLEKGLKQCEIVKLLNRSPSNNIQRNKEKYVYHGLCSLQSERGSKKS